MAESVSYIYSSHTFEHFTWEQSLTLARECFRVMRSGGSPRVVVPDLRLIVQDYMESSDPLASHRFLERLSLAHTFHDFVHPGANHSQMFDERSLVHLMKQAGFSHPEVRHFMESCIPDVASVELASRQRESLYVEASK